MSVDVVVFVPFVVRLLVASFQKQLRSNNGLVACCIINGKEYR